MSQGPTAEITASLRAGLAAARFDESFREFHRLFKDDRVAAYRLLRDLWLNGELPDMGDAPSGSPWTYLFRASHAWRQGRDLEALALLHRASAASPDFLWARYFIAEILLRRLDFYPLARLEIEGVLRGCHWLWEARCLWAEILLALGSPSALKATQGVVVPPGNSQAAFLAWRGALSLWAGRYAAALSDLDVAASLQNPDASCWRGATRVMLGRLEAALGDLDGLLRRDPHDHEGLIWRGEAYRLLGQPSKSLADLDAAIAQNGEKPWAHVNRALIHLQRKDAPAALEDFYRLAPFYSEHGLKPKTIKTDKLRRLLEDALKRARGCRRSDTHLNIAWMRASGVPVPERPAPGARLLYWMRHVAIPLPARAVSRTGQPTETDVKTAVGRLSQ